jgi:hypothetical protein
LHTTGWHMCKQLPFVGFTEPYSVLYGPIHPRNAPIDREVNLRTFQKLYDLVKRKKINLTVRWLPPFDGNGIPRVEGVTYIEGDLNVSTEHIDQADIVVGHQTFAYLAVARGKPTLMMGEWIPPHTARDNYVSVKNWDKYKHLVMYPLDILEEGKDTLELMREACANPPSVQKWRARMIGHEFNPSEFVRLIQSYLT